MKQLVEMMGDLGFDFSHEGAKWGGVVEVYDAALQSAITELRKSGLNIMMSMKDQSEADLLCRGLRRAARSSGGIYRARLTDCSPVTARAAHGMRMPARAACMCVPC